MVEIELLWKFIEIGLVSFGTSVYWILKRNKDAAMVSSIIFGLIDRGKYPKQFKIMAIDRYTDSLKKRGFDMSKFAENFKKKYDEQ